MTLSDPAGMAKRNVPRMLWLLCFVVLGFEQSADAQQTELVKRIDEHRYELTVQKGEMGGPGAEVLEKAVSAAQFVAIGEEHGTREVPEFVWAICRTMAQNGLDAMAIEAGPLVTAQLEQWTAREDGGASLLAFEQQYPDSIAFFYWRQEFDLLAHCQQASLRHSPQLWGLDQEFLGAPSFILQQIVETRPGRAAESIARNLQARCDADTRQSMASGNWRDGCLLRLARGDLASLQSAVKHSGNRRAQQLAAALVKTHHIYNLHETAHRYDANRERARWMKQNFLARYRQLSQSTGKPPRVLLKFGANHLFKGINETELNDLGNFVTELADGLGSTSLHIEVLGIRGEDEAEVGPGQPDRAVAKDIEPGALAPLYSEAFPGGWTVFDLRPLRSQFASFGPVDRDLERLILGYDMLVLVPEVTAQAVIQ